MLIKFGARARLPSWNGAAAVLRDPKRRAVYDHDHRRSTEAAQRRRRAPSPASAGPSADEGTGRRRANSSSRSDAGPSAQPRSSSTTPGSAARPARELGRSEIGAWLVQDHLGQWAALVLVALSAWLFGLLIAWDNPLGAVSGLVVLAMSIQPFLAGRWRSTPLADLAAIARRVIVWAIGPSRSRLLSRLLARHS